MSLAIWIRAKEKEEGTESEEIFEKMVMVIRKSRLERRAT